MYVNEKSANIIVRSVTCFGRCITEKCTYAIVYTNVLHVLAFGLQYFTILPAL